MFSTKQELIEHVITLFRREGYSYTDGKNLRKDATEVFLLDDLENFLSSKYSWLKEQDIYAILPKVRKEGKFHDFNKNFFQKLREGYVYRRAGELNSHSIHLIDFSNVESNIFRVVSGLSFSTNLSAVHNTDLIVYINGIPFIVWAFKDPQEKLQGAETLIKDTLSGCLPELLRYNAFCVICNGINKTKYGISWGEWRDYREWKRVDEKEQPSNENILVSTIRGLFNQERLLKVLESFICFADSNSREKIICRYPQFFASIKLLKSIEEHSKVTEKGDGKGGVYFGTAGCGKSYTMLFLAKLLQKSKLLNNPTIVLITDRISLDRQLHGLFLKHENYLSCGEISRVKSGEELHKVLSRATGGGVYSTTIQKFRDFGDEALSERANIICIADEAHRSQDCESNKWGKREDGKWDVSKPLAKVLRDCLPNATYIGFTATPKTNTLEVFGEIVDSYGMRQSIDDGFTVAIEIFWAKKAEFKFDTEVATEMETKDTRDASEWYSSMKSFCGRKKKSDYQNAGLVLGRKKISKDFGGFSLEVEKWNDSREKFFPLDIQVMGENQALKDKHKENKRLVQEIEIDDEITKVVGVRLDQVVISETGIGGGVEREIKWGNLKRPTWTSELIK